MQECSNAIFITMLLLIILLLLLGFQTYEFIVVVILRSELLYFQERLSRQEILLISASVTSLAANENGPDVFNKKWDLKLNSALKFLTF